MNKLLLLFAVCCLVGCTTQSPSERTQLITSDPLDTEGPIDLTSTKTLEAEQTSLPSIASTPKSTLTVSPTITVTITSIPTTELVLKEGCPTLIDSGKPTVWDNGSILFNIGLIRDNYTPDYLEVMQPGIWAVSSNNLSPIVFLESAWTVSVSTDGYTVLSLNTESPESQTFTFYDLLNNSLTHVSVPVNIFPPSHWLSDGRVRAARTLEKTLGKGEVWEVFIVDSITQIVDESIVELNLPEYEYAEYEVERGMPSGFVAVDPTFERVLYTAGNGKEHEVRLLNLETGEILWQGSATSLTNTFPEWSQDGERVLFTVGEPIQGTTYAWSRIVSLNRDGIEEELPYQPFPGAENMIANVSRSPDNRFIFYSLYNYETERLHGYIIDTITWEVGDVCDLNNELFGSLPYDNIEIEWLPAGQLVYRVLTEKNGQLAHSLRVLDVPSWTAQVVFEAEPGYGVNVFGWTPMTSFP